jgi:dipeptidyl-peptidase-3
MKAIRRLVAALVIAVILPTAAWAQKPSAKGGSSTPARSGTKSTAASTAKSSVVERIGDTAYVQVEADSFNSLTPRQKELVYWLGQASIAIDPIIYDQCSRFGLRQKYVLDLIAAHPKGIAPATLEKIDAYTKRFWANHGNHNDTTAQKFVPAFTPEELQAAALQALRNTPQASMTEAQLREELESLKQSLFDPEFEPQLTAKSPRGGLDIIQASANNFYGPGVTLADLAHFKEEHPLNSRVIKGADGTLIEEVYRAGTPDGSIKPGLYAQYLGKAIDYLGKARPVAEPGQAEVIDALIRYYQTGEYRDWIAFGVKWVGNNPTVDFANGFIEVYRDARGQKGTSQSFVSITDATLNRLMQKIGANAQYFEEHAPWAEQYKKLGVKPPMAKAIETTIETGDFPVSIVGDNLPNENEVREKYGTKSFLYDSSTRALNRARGQATTSEFAYDDTEKRIVSRYGDQAEDLLTAMHEIIGHGSGKVSPKLTQDPSTYLREYYSTLEEARADLMALWNAFDPKLQELGLVTKANQREVARAMYYNQFRAPLVQLRSIPKGDTIEEDHQRDRELIALYVMDKVPGSLEWTHRNDKTFIHILDFDKVHKGVGMLLAELMRIKGEGDYDAVKALIDQYGVHFDPKLRDEVVARYRKLDIPTYYAGVSADLKAVMKDGQVTSVTISYPRNVTRQRSSWAAMYHPELAP